MAFTRKEQDAINELKSLAKKWPETLTLFSWSGTLCVFKTRDLSKMDDYQFKANSLEKDIIRGIPNDGGDP